jgi:phosphoribosylaminoimidazolecarboxamide formyltransferase/IMP cyclohydrolase
MNEMRAVRRALISVSDKRGIAEFALELAALGIEIISTGGTAKTLRHAGLTVTDVSEVTGFPEMMDGRVKTLHPYIHGALLAMRDDFDHIAAMQVHGIEPIDLVVVNLYPFERTVAAEGVALEEAVENIDIGGPSMIRSAAKNWRYVAVVTDTRLYAEVIDELKSNSGSLSIETRQRLSTLAFTRTASYDLAISSYFAGQLGNDDLERLEPLNPLGDLVFIDASEFSSSPETGTESGPLPDFTTIELAKVADLRYGENPHQKAALYDNGEGGGIANAEQLHGKEMSYNNYVDAGAAWDLVHDLDEQAVAIIKHTNPSGVGIGESNEEAYKRALSTDPVSAFGGIVAFNRRVDAAVAALVTEVFTEVVIAHEFDEEALEIFRSKKNLRVLKLADHNTEMKDQTPHLVYKQISGGFLVQDADTHRLSPSDLKVVTKRQPTDEELKSMLLAWTVCKRVKSNAIVFANEHQTLGVGAGQMNRVDSVRIAAMRAERFDLPLSGSALASDAFFPFRDNVDEAAKFGVSAIIQPGGSIKDDESIAAADEHGMTMVLTSVRHFNH